MSHMPGGPTDPDLWAILAALMDGRDPGVKLDEATLRALRASTPDPDSRSFVLVGGWRHTLVLRDEVGHLEIA